MKKVLPILAITTVLITLVFCFALPTNAYVSEGSYIQGLYKYDVSKGEAIITDCNASAAGEIIIPDTLGGYPVTQIYTRAFYYCTNITRVVIPETVTKISNKAFQNCSSLTDISMPDNMTSIESDAFLYTGIYNDENNWENDVLYIGDYLIAAKTSIKGDCSIKDGTKLIAGSAFLDCKKLTGVIIPDSVTAICHSAFENCTGLTNITIPKSVTTISGFTFSGCTELKSITIPYSVTNIDNFVFGDCINLEKVYYDGSEEDWGKITIGSYNNRPLLNAKLVTPQSEAIENAIAGTPLSTGVVGGKTVIIVPTSKNGIAMTESELGAIFNDASIKITSNNGIIGTGCKVTIGEYEVDLVVKGDIDGDGVATVFDALMVKKALANNGFENEALREFAGDVDDTEGTTEADVNALLAMIVGKN